MFEIKENIYCFQYMFFYLFIIYSLFYISILFKNLPQKKDVNFIIKVMEYWKKKPIWTMKVLDENSSEEPKDMEKYSFGKWPGNIKGCNCSRYYYDYFIKDECTELNLTNNCHNVKEQKPITIYNYLFKYYVTYYDADYLTLYSRIDNTKIKCKSGYKKCGILDNSYHPFCVKETENCVLNYFYFENNKKNVNYGFSEDLIDTNNVINNIFIKDTSGCILNEDSLYDQYLLFKNNSDKFEKCDSTNSTTIYNVILNSSSSKSLIYHSNGIYKNEKIPGEYYYNNELKLYSMKYFALKNSISEYSNSDAFIFIHLKLMNFLIFFFLKVGIQYGYYIFIKKTTESKKYFNFNIGWLIIFLVYLILIWKFNNSLCKTARLISFESDYNNFYSIMRKLRNIEIFLAFIILIVHGLKLIYIYTLKEETKYSQFINNK
jgi:hypothetical protein